MRNLFPRPLFCEEKDGVFCFADTLYLIVGADAQDREIADFRAELCRKFTCQKTALKTVVRPEVTGTARIALTPDAPLTAAKTEYEYEITCDADGLFITYSEPLGLFHAFSTFLQMISMYRRATGDFAIPFCHIKDKPALLFRGLHLISLPDRPFWELLKVIRLCGLLKCTHIAIEFWGTLQYDCLKELAWPGAYTKEQARELAREARAFGMEIIPTLTHFGHASFARFRSGRHVLLDQAPEYEELFLEGGWTWNIKNPETRALLRAMRAELCELFPGEYFHITCDEGHACNWMDLETDALDDEKNDAFVHYLNGVIAEVKREGRTPILWGDMFLDRENFAYPFCANHSPYLQRNVKNLQMLSKDACIADWQYNIDGTKDESVLHFLSERDPKTMLLTPWETKENIRGRCALAQKHGLLGILGSTWHHLNYQFMWCVFYAACQSWHTDLDYLDKMGVEIPKVTAGRWIGKLNPFDGDRTKLGFVEHELLPDIDHDGN